MGNLICNHGDSYGSLLGNIIQFIPNASTNFLSLKNHPFAFHLLSTTIYCVMHERIQSTPPMGPRNLPILSRPEDARTGSTVTIYTGNRKTKKKKKRRNRLRQEKRLEREMRNLMTARIKELEDQRKGVQGSFSFFLVLTRSHPSPPHPFSLKFLLLFFHDRP